MKERKCKAVVYDFNVSNGIESEIEVLSITGQRTKKSPCIFARTGKYPDYNEVVEYDEASRQFDRWLGSKVINDTRDGYIARNAYKKGGLNKYDKVDVGEVFVEYAIDFLKGESGRRYKFIFTKA